MTRLCELRYDQVSSGRFVIFWLGHKNLLYLSDQGYVISRLDEVRLDQVRLGFLNDCK